MVDTGSAPDANPSMLVYPTASAPAMRHGTSRSTFARTEPRRHSCPSCGQSSNSRRAILRQGVQRCSSGRSTSRRSSHALPASPWGFSASGASHCPVAVGNRRKESEVGSTACISGRARHRVEGISAAAGLPGGRRRSACHRCRCRCEACERRAAAVLHRTDRAPGELAADGTAGAVRTESDEHVGQANATGARSAARRRGVAARLSAATAPTRNAHRPPLIAEHSEAPSESDLPLAPQAPLVFVNQ